MVYELVQIHINSVILLQLVSHNKIHMTCAAFEIYIPLHIVYEYTWSLEIPCRLTYSILVNSS